MAIPLRHGQRTEALARPNGPTRKALASLLSRNDAVEVEPPIGGREFEFKSGGKPIALGFNSGLMHLILSRWRR